MYIVCRLTPMSAHELHAACFDAAGQSRIYDENAACTLIKRVSRRVSVDVCVLAAKF